MDRIKTKKGFSRKRLSDMLWGYACVAPLSVGLLLFLADRKSVV